jgi:ribosome-binding protein aMBF1 (putative translation factor)
MKVRYSVVPGAAQQRGERLLKAEGVDREYRGRVFVDLRGLRGVRESRGLSQRELARRSGVSYVNISRIEHQGQPATVDTAVKLARALETHLTELVIPQEERIE